MKKVVLFSLIFAYGVMFGINAQTKYIYGLRGEKEYLKVSPKNILQVKGISDTVLLRGIFGQVKSIDKSLYQLTDPLIVN